jgi:hypothetical protein
MPRPRKVLPLSVSLSLAYHIALIEDRTVAPDPATVREIVKRRQNGQYKAARDVNHHSASHERGDNVARSIGWIVALTRQDCDSWGIPYVLEHESGRGIRLFDAKTRLGDRVSVKGCTRADPLDDTAHVVTTICAGSFDSTTAAILKGCPMVVIYARGDVVDLDRMIFQVIDVRAILRSVGGDIAKITDRTGLGHPGAGGSGLMWGNWVMRKDKETGREHGPYFEVSVTTRHDPWQTGTLADIEAQVAAVLRRP